MATYGDILKLWQFVLPWLLQVQPGPRQIMVVNYCFTELARAMVEDTGIQNFHDIDSLADRPIGLKTQKWLKESRPILSNIYPHFRDRYELIFNPRGDTPLE